jgi:hypothetical protein
MMEAGTTSETLANVYQSTRRKNPEDSHILERACLLLIALIGDPFLCPLLFNDILPVSKMLYLQKRELL